MLATTGYIVQECLRWPGYLSPSAGVKFSEIPNGIKGLAAIPPAGLFQIFVGIGLMEIATWRYYEGPWPGSVPAGKLPGDVAGDLWVRYADPEVKKTKLNIEINNGRAAMLGSLGMIMHDHLTGSCARPPAPSRAPAARTPVAARRRRRRDRARRTLRLTLARCPRSPRPQGFRRASKSPLGATRLDGVRITRMEPLRRMCQALVRGCKGAFRGRCTLWLRRHLPRRLRGLSACVVVAARACAPDRPPLSDMSVCL